MDWLVVESVAATLTMPLWLDGTASFAGSIRACATSTIFADQLRAVRTQVWTYTRLGEHSKADLEQIYI